MGVLEIGVLEHSEHSEYSDMPHDHTINISEI